MDYGRLNRKELQALCKQHGIPANKTNAYMSEALGALLNKHEESEHLQEVDSDLEGSVECERPTNIHDALQVLNDLSSMLANVALDAASQSGETDEGLVEEMMEVPTVPQQEAEAAAEVVRGPVKVRRSGRKPSAKPNSKPVIDAAPALVEPTLEVVLHVENSTNLLPSARSASRTYARRVPVELESEAVDTVMPSQEHIIRPVTDQIVEEEETTSPAKSKKPKAKGKRSKSMKPVSLISVQILDEAIVPPTMVAEMPESPTLGLTSDVMAHEEIQIQRAPSLSPAPGDDAFEFHPVPESFAEIMTPGKPLVEAAKGCQHRISRRGAKSCKSCASETKVASIMQEVLQAIEVPKVHALPLEPATEAMDTTPAKQDDKENALKNIDLQSLSIRKLQKEVRKRGLSKRNNTKVKA
ncbi:unnamed protein product [Calypogeia fissa]